MRKQRIAYDKRFSLWRSHNGRCPYCGEQVRLLDMQVDHVLPESLALDPNKLCDLKREYGLEESFDLLDYCNWLPAHPACNRRKGADVLDKAAVLFYVALAKAKVPLARAEEERLARARAADMVVGRLLAAVENGLVTKEQVESALAAVPQETRVDFDPIVIGFGTALDEVLESGLLPKSVRIEFPSLYDWLEEDLHMRIRSATKAHFFCPEASARNGETLSVRLAFTELDLKGLNDVDWSWWEILEVDYYSTLYGPQ